MSLILSSLCLDFLLIIIFSQTPSQKFTCSIMFPVIRFHYDVMKKKYRDNIQLLLTDTDSLM